MKATRTPYTPAADPVVGAALAALVDLGLEVADLPGSGSWQSRCPRHPAGAGVAITVESAGPGRVFIECTKRCSRKQIADSLRIDQKTITDRPAVMVKAPRCVGSAVSRSPAAPPAPASAATTRPTRPLPAVRPFVPFPVNVLPDALRELALSGASAIGCDPAFIILPALSTLSAAIGATHRIEVKGRWREPPYISTAVIAPSGAKKTPPYKLACEDPAEDLNDELEDEFVRELPGYELQLSRWEDRRHAEQDGADPRPVKPVERRFAVSDITLEKLIGRLEENPRGLLAYRDELDGWLRSFTRYASGGSSDLPSWLSLFNAATVNYSRKTGDRKEVRVRGVGVSVTGTIQPGVMREAMSPALMSAGLFARLAVAMPPVSARVWTDDEVSDAVAERYGELVRRLFRLDFAERIGLRRTKPVVLQMAPDARKRFKDFYNRNGDAMGMADAPEAASRSKLEAYAARLALVFSRCHPVAPDEVMGEDMAAGVAVAEWFCDEVPRVYRLLTEATSAADLRDLGERVSRLARTKHGGRLTARDLHKANKSRFPTADMATLALETLVGGGLGTWSESPPGTRGQPTRYFTPQTDPVTPETDQSEAS